MNNCFKYLFIYGISRIILLRLRSHCYLLSKSEHLSSLERREKGLESQTFALATAHINCQAYKLSKKVLIPTF